MQACIDALALHKTALNIFSYICILQVPFKFTNILVPDCEIRVVMPSLPQRGQNFGKVKGMVLSTIIQLCI